MFTSQILRIRFFAMLVLTVIVGASVYAFAAANVVPETGAGDGSDAISGYTVTNVDYTVNSDGNPVTLDAVSLDVDATAGASAPGEVYVQVIPSGSWFTCTGPTGSTWACTITSTNTVSATELHVVATE